MGRRGSASGELGVEVVGVLDAGAGPYLPAVADERFAEAHAELEGSGSGRRRIEPSDYHARGVLYVPEEARFDALLELPEGADLGKAIDAAMRAVEEANPDLAGVLPRVYAGLPNDVLVELVRLLAPLTSSLDGDGFGLIYEYFLGQFAFAEGSKGGEFFTPTSIVRLIVEIIEPFHGRILDPACGSGGMFVQSAHSGAETWRIRNLLVSAIAAVETLGHDDARRLGRCALLRTGQWALDMRESIPTVTEFRQQLSRDVASMAEVAREHRDDVLSASGRADEPIVIDAGLPESASHAALARRVPPSLILTSPPYPGVYVNYRRWKVQGRRETPAPYWVADRLDGHGIARYTMSARNRDGLRLYFEKLRTAYAAIVGLMGPATWLVQVVGFNDGDEQLRRYLNLMSEVGLEEVRFEALSTDTDGRLWRQVPGRRWWVSARELSETAPSTAREVVLVHRRVS